MRCQCWGLFNMSPSEGAGSTYCSRLPHLLRQSRQACALLIEIPAASAGMTGVTETQGPHVNTTEVPARRGDGGVCLVLALPLLGNPGSAGDVVEQHGDGHGADSARHGRDCPGDLGYGVEVHIAY